MTTSIRAIVVDLDGTLLNSRKTASPRSLNALKACREAGMEIVAATARPPRSVALLCPELIGIAHMIYYNGALTIERDSQACSGIPIHGKLVQQVIQYMQEHHRDILASVENEDRLYVNRGLLNHERDALGIPRGDEQPEIASLSRFFESGAAKLLLTGFEPFEPFLAAFGGSLSIVRTDGGSLVQLMHADVSKAAALETLLAPRGISLAETIAFGDDYNDMPLFMRCGFPVAMGNAIPELKQLAWRVAGTNDEDGVAVMLEKLLA